MTTDESRVAGRRRALRIAAACAAFALLATFPVRAADEPKTAAAVPVASVDEQARYLAGLPLPENSPLAKLTDTPAYKTHRTELDTGWAKLEEKRLTKMSAWAKEEIAPRINPKAPVMYLFGGPDAISVDVIYPEAPVYVLAGLEPVGAVPRIDTMSKAEIEHGLTTLRTALRSTINVSFFITSEMSSTLLKTPIRGVLPIVYLFLARNGNHIVDTQYVYIDATGKLESIPPGTTPDNGVPGVRVRFQREGGPVRELYYFRLDVENEKLPARPGFIKYLESLGPVNSFLKAASFILHDNNFSKTRDYLLAHSASILQDDSGIPFHYLKGPKWNLVYFGEYTPPRIKVFRGHYQPEMKKAFEQGGAKELPFSTGYTHDHGSNLLLALAKADASAKM